ncbi:hypothetical protein CBR_g32061 [Chara braunii]|uniref:Amino acid transporter transmembrane domain-containing protein n=1 Tax=Chara braunii TaxID=69332 RepID=A0A388LGJ3_CHABU|nr:hypothetical protein CBR_g32061 [Chara braunii]|eukprot:GBG81387.1 hypothetical protein CBR_g32061 [Chara braunii]
MNLSLFLGKGDHDKSQLRWVVVELAAGWKAVAASAEHKFSLIWAKATRVSGAAAAAIAAAGRGVGGGEGEAAAAAAADSQAEAAKGGRSCGGPSTGSLERHGDLKSSIMAGGGGAERGVTYGPLVGSIFLFNLFIGTGVLALPALLLKAGWVLSTIFLIIVACLSFVGVTFMIECMATANAILLLRKKMSLLQGHTAEDVPLLPTSQGRDPFSIVLRMEMGEMANLFFNDVGKILFYCTLIAYFVGDIIIYSTVIPKSIVDFIYGPVAPPSAFFVYLAIFSAFIVPFCFFDFQKTKPLQLATMGMRQAGLLIILILSWRTIYENGSRAPEIPKAAPSGLPNLFGGAVYSFMCHHSLPGIITPIKDKSRLSWVVGRTLATVFAVYMSMFLSCAIAFGSAVSDPITFNFGPDKFGFVGGFLVLFPVFTLSSNFPMVAITLRNNLDTLWTLLQSRTETGEAQCDSHIPRTAGWMTSSAGNLVAQMVRSAPPKGKGKRKLLLDCEPEGVNAVDDPERRSGDRQGEWSISHEEEEEEFAEQVLVDAGHYNNEARNAADLRPRIDVSLARRTVLTILTVGPPLALTALAEMWSVDLNSLVGTTGLYAGCGVMFVIPACLVLCARRELAKESAAFALESNSSSSADYAIAESFISTNNPHASPFRGTAWVAVLLVWAVIATIFNIVQKILDFNQRYP